MKLFPTIPLFWALVVAASILDLCSSFSVNPISRSFHRLSRPLYLSDEPSLSSISDEEPSSTPKPAVKCPDCDLCDGSGRILGGIGVILPWWPIKAYRPCPNFIDKGGFYQRSGQGLDEIAFGRDSTFDKGGN